VFIVNLRFDVANVMTASPYAVLLSNLETVPTIGVAGVPGSHDQLTDLRL
jgi:hypothetical protein